MPRQAHSANADFTGLVKAIQDETLFVRPNGTAQGFEHGLAMLLQFSLIFLEIERLSHPRETELPPYLSSSPLNLTDALREYVRSAILDATRSHCDALSLAVPASIDEELPSEVAPLDDDGEWHDLHDIVAAHEPDLDGHVRSHREEIDADPLQKRLAAMYSQKRNRDGRQKANELLRNDQNAINLATYDTIHPPKPPPSPVVIPALEDLHDNDESQATMGPSMRNYALIGRTAGRAATTTGVVPRPEPAVTREQPEKGDFGGSFPKQQSGRARTTRVKGKRKGVSVDKPKLGGPRENKGNPPCPPQSPRFTRCDAGCDTQWLSERVGAPGKASDMYRPTRNFIRLNETK